MDRDFVTRLFAGSLDQATKMVEPIACEDCARLAGAKHPAWLLGHLVVGADFASSMCGLPMEHEAMHPLFAPGTIPEADRGKYPKKAELLELLTKAHARASAAFEKIPDDALAQEFPVEEYRSFFPRVGDGVVYLLAHHEPYHLGQLQQWALATGHAPKQTSE
ncbi:MAG: DinB family protein [Phycisphaerales bacterium]